MPWLDLAWAAMWFAMGAAAVWALLTPPVDEENEERWIYRS